ncbi:chemotaxis protein CheB [Stenotrophomonas sp. MMGLT7]|uniref:chemotaxis protein CheB n=1 Tax=Stenotrophomonas sp. MMGLT7 TaxID=2901227 RepID=UPI001E5936AF|nr:chemotaxis protein CheB [Stenotrophomonas sp. MMGLT7]MCD7097400.1 chemotaxis protein [Stenotrophomonas sp. MMGLT7]
MRDALVRAGAHLVLEDDPQALDGQALAAAAPMAVLVALEPAIEDALERLQPSLSAAGLTVVFDEAELAARREGWEAQRWARHLLAKLRGSGNVLPPGAEDDAASVPPAPGLASTPLHAHAPVTSAIHAGEAPGAAVRFPADETQVPAAALADSSTWTLVDADDAAPVVRAAGPAAPDVAPAGLSLLEIEAAGPRPGGAVLLLAGIGGPDAVRRLLAALPADFSRPVLVQLRLDGGQYGNLARQIARVSALPVMLAEAGQAVAAAQAYVLPDDIGLQASDGGLRFVPDRAAHPLLAALPPAESAVLVLSGADVDQTGDVLAFAAQGGWVAGQGGEGCYDASAAACVTGQGLPGGEPAQLALSLARRWGA